MVGMQDVVISGVAMSVDVEGEDVEVVVDGAVVVVEVVVDGAAVEVVVVGVVVGGVGVAV